MCPAAGIGKPQRPPRSPRARPASGAALPAVPTIAWALPARAAFFAAPREPRGPSPAPIFPPARSSTPAALVAHKPYTRGSPRPIVAARRARVARHLLFWPRARPAACLSCCRRQTAPDQSSGSTTSNRRRKFPCGWLPSQPATIARAPACHRPRREIAIGIAFDRPDDRPHSGMGQGDAAVVG